MVTADWSPVLEENPMLQALCATWDDKNLNLSIMIVFFDIVSFLLWTGHYSQPSSGKISK